MGRSDGGRGGTADRHFWRWVAALGSAAFALRVGWVVYAAHTPHGLYDPARYLRSAELIAKGKGYVEPLTGKPTAYYPPGYPWFLGAAAWVAHHNPLVRDTVHLAGYVQAALGTITVAAVAVIGRRVASARVAIAAAAIVALYPNLVFHTAALLSETLCIALLAVAIAALWWHPRGERLRQWQVVTFATLFGLSVLVRPISLPVLLVVVGWAWVELGDRRTVARVVAASVGVLALLVGCWTIRNAVQLRGFVPLSTNTGDNLCIGHGHQATGGFRLDPDCAGRRSILEGPAGELAHDREARATAWREIGATWTREPWLTWRRLDIMFTEDHDALDGVTSFQTDHWMSGPTFSALGRIADDYGAVVLAFGLIGAVVLAARRRPDAVALVGIAVVLVAVPLAFFGDPRFKVPAMPFIAIAAAVAIDAAVSWMVSRAAGLAGGRRRSTP